MDELLVLLSKNDLKNIDRVIKDQNQTFLFKSTDSSSLELVKCYLRTNLDAEIIDISPEKGGKIKIDQARQLLELTCNTHHKARYFFISEADLMTIAAQNALLKIFEEPNKNNFFILFSTNYRNFLPTVLSRFKLIRLDKINSSKIKQALKPQFTDITNQQLAQIEFVAGSDLSIWLKMLDDPQFFEQQLALANLAKKLLMAKSLYQKIILIQKVKKDRQQAIELINILLKMYRQLFLKTPSDNHQQAMLKYSQALDELARNSNVGLTLIKAML